MYDEDVSNLSDSALKTEFQELHGAEVFDDVDISLSNMKSRDTRLTALEEEAERRNLPVKSWTEEVEKSSTHYCSGAPYP